jgi:signal transduction histidine kinase
MPKGGSITITSKETYPDLELSVSDTGAGIPEEIMNRIWEPLFTTKPKGMGFGLAICKKIVEAHGGSITVDSEVGLDTVFTITLSLVQDGDVSSQTSLPDVLQIGSIEKTA